jgi:membrane protein YdbS with pleckstrin-like domain
MAFPRRLLRDGEELIIDLRPHPIAIAFNVFVAVLVLVAMTLILINIPDSWATWVRITTATLAILVILVVSVPGIIGWLTSHFVITSERVIQRSGWISKHEKDIPLDRVQNITFSQSIFERMIGAGDLTLESAGEESDTMFKDVRNPEHVQKTIYVIREQDEQRRIRPDARGPDQPPRPEPAVPDGPGSRVGMGSPVEPGSPDTPTGRPNVPAGPPDGPTARPEAPTIPLGTGPASGPKPSGGYGGSVADELEKLVNLRDRGVISEAEFQEQKSRLLGS